MNKPKKTRLYVNKYGYTFDRYLFRGCLGLMLLLFFIIAFQNNFDIFSRNIYVKCDVKPYCYNSLYMDNRCKFDWCNQEILPYGFEFGKKPSVLIGFFNPICIIIFFACVFINHFKYNKGKRLIKLEGL